MLCVNRIEVTINKDILNARFRKFNGNLLNKKENTQRKSREKREENSDRMLKFPGLNKGSVIESETLRLMSLL